jgi:hypothetical protein
LRLGEGIFGIRVLRCLGRFCGVLLDLQGLYVLFLWVVCRVLLWVVVFGLVGVLSELGFFLGAFRRS